MLLKIRSALQGNIAKLILVLVLVPFSLVGMDLFFGGQSSRTVVEVEGEKISEEDIIQAAKISRVVLLESMRQQGEEAADLDEEMVRNLSLRELVRNTLLKKQAKIFSMVMSDEITKRIIVGMDAFKQDGNFASYLYLDFLRTIGITPDNFEEYIASQYLSRQLNEGMFSTDFMTTKELDSVIRIFNEKRDIRYLRIPPSQYTEEVAVADEEIQAFYNENLQDFMTTETVSVEYVELRLEDFYEDPLEEEVAAEFRAREASGELPVQRKVSHILLRIDEDEEDDAEKMENLAAELRERIEAGEDFADLAREYSDDTSSAEEGGDMGELEAGDLPSALEVALEEMEEGELSEPLRSSFGVHLLWLREASRPDYAELRDKLWESLREQHAQNKFAEKKGTMLDIGFSASDLEEVSYVLELPVLKTEFFDISGGTDISASEVFRAAAFSEEVRTGNNSEVLDVEAGHAVVLRALQYVPPEQRPFEEVQTEVRNTLKQRGAEELAQQQSEQLVAQLRDGADLETLAREQDLEWYVNLEATRDMLTVDSGILNKAFALLVPPEDTKTPDSIHLEDGDYIVLEIANVQPGSIAGVTTEEREDLRLTLLKESRDKNLSRYNRSLHATADIQMVQ